MVLIQRKQDSSCAGCDPLFFVRSTVRVINFFFHFHADLFFIFHVFLQKIFFFFSIFFSLSHFFILFQDAVTMAAADEANPLAHPDALRRKRTLRDAGLAAKASSFQNSGGTGATDNDGNDNVTGGGAAGGGQGEEEGGEAPWIGRRVVGVGGHAQIVAPDRSTAPMSLGSRYENINSTCCGYCIGLVWLLRSSDRLEEASVSRRKINNKCCGFCIVLVWLV